MQRERGGDTRDGARAMLRHCPGAREGRGAPFRFQTLPVQPFSMLCCLRFTQGAYPLFSLLKWSRLNHRVGALTFTCLKRDADATRKVIAQHQSGSRWPHFRASGRLQFLFPLVHPLQASPQHPDILNFTDSKSLTVSGVEQANQDAKWAHRRSGIRVVCVGVTFSISI